MTNPRAVRDSADFALGEFLGGPRDGDLEVFSWPAPPIWRIPLPDPPSAGWVGGPEAPELQPGLPVPGRIGTYRLEPGQYQIVTINYQTLADAQRGASGGLKALVMHLMRGRDGRLHYAWEGEDDRA